MFNEGTCSCSTRRLPQEDASPVQREDVASGSRGIQFYLFKEKTRLLVQLECTSFCSPRRALLLNRKMCLLVGVEDMSCGTAGNVSSLRLETWPLVRQGAMSFCGARGTRLLVGTGDMAPVEQEDMSSSMEQNG